MSKRPLTRIATGITAAIALALTTTAAAAPVPSPAPAGNGQALAALKAKCNAAVQNRETALTADATKINAAADLISSDKSALLGIESADASGLATLDATIQADTTFSQARTDCQKIVTDYHVYVLYEPQVDLVIAADSVSAINSKVAALATELQQKLSGNTNPAVQAALADLAMQVAAAQSSVNGVSAEVLALTPAGYPGNKTTLQSAHSSLMSVRADLKQARKDIDTIRDALKTAAPGPSPSA